MDTFLYLYDQYQNTFHFVAVLAATFVLAQLVLFVFQTVLAGLARRTATTFDDGLISIIKRPVYWSIIVGGLYFALLQIDVLADYQGILLVVTKLFLVVLLVILGTGLSNMSLGWIEHRGKMSKRQAAFVNTIRKLVNAVIYFMGLIFILQLFGLAISPLIASLGIGGLVIGLALQSTLSNYFSGLYVAAEGFIQPDDFIELDNGLKGSVVQIGWRNTILRQWNNNLVMIPNSKLADSVITNYNEPENKMDFVVCVGVGYNTDLKKAERTALQVGRELQKNNKFGVASYKPAVRFYEFADSNINMKLVLQAKDYGSHFEMSHEAIKGLKEAFDKAKVNISFPVRTVQLVNPEFLSPKPALAARPALSVVKKKAKLKKPVKSVKKAKKVKK
ncbi:MAG: mechanosensitive ion channel family protein [Candidatus Peregrinibacteria bacterium]